MKFVTTAQRMTTELAESLSRLACNLARTGDCNLRATEVVSVGKELRAVDWAVVDWD